jgi:hypothetical protein
LADPTRADLVAAIGDVTGAVAPQAIYDRMKSDPTGQRKLQGKPLVDLSSLDLAVLPRTGPTNTISTDGTTTIFRQAYGSFMATSASAELSTISMTIDNTPIAMLQNREVAD